MPLSQSFLEGLLRFLPSWMDWVRVGPVSLLYVGMASRFSGWLRTGRGLDVAYTRKVFHFAIIPLAGIVQVFVGLPGTVVYGTTVSGFVLHALWRGDRSPFYRALARPSDRPHRSLFIFVPLVMTGLGGVLSNLMFGSLSTVGYWVCGVGDAVAEPVGRRWGHHEYQVPSLAGVPATRSYQGSAAVFAAGAAAACLALSLSGVEGGEVWRVGLACGGVSCGVEAFSNHGLDNLTIQLAASGTAYLLLV